MTTEQMYAIAQAARINFGAFVKACNPQTELTDFHLTYYLILQAFAEKRLRKLIVSMPPQHGKSFGSTINLPAYIFGINPDCKMVIASYSAMLARKFNRSMQRQIDSDGYRLIFPDTSINSKNVVTTSNWLRNADGFEIINRTGYLRAVGREGTLTGTPADVLIMDDLYKDGMEANSPTIRESAWEWYTQVARTRLHNDSQELIVFTRWHEEDIIGRLLSIEPHKFILSLSDLDGIFPNTWAVINFEAIKESGPTEIDPRGYGEALWSGRHSVEKLLITKRLDPIGFQSLYQGDPKPIEGLMYSNFKTYEVIPHTKKAVCKNYTDTADTGSDFLCSICYIETEIGCYVTDILYTDKPMEYTEVKTAEMLAENRTEVANIESNNGGRGFARNVEKQCRIMGDNRVRIETFTQSENKASRIFTRSAEVQNMLLYPSDWERSFPKFAQAIKSYRKEGRNAHDDAPDAVTGIVEKIDNSRTVSEAEILRSFN